MTMTPSRWDDFPRIWSIDFEYGTGCPTGRPLPHTFVATEIDADGRPRIDTQIRLSGPELRGTRAAPFDVRHDLVLAYNFIAESRCFEALGWEQPRWPLDLYAEHVAFVNGRTAADVYGDETGEDRVGYRQIDAMRVNGLLVRAEKEAHKRRMQLLGARGEPYIPEEWAELRDYCAGDTTDLIDLFRAMRARIDRPAALVRGRYMIVKGQQMYRGILMDVGLVARFQAARLALRQQQIDETPAANCYYHGLRFRESEFCRWADGEGIGLPLDHRGRPVLNKETLKKIVAIDPRLRSYARLRATLAKLEEFTVDLRSDGRIRPDCWPLGTRTGRDRAKATEFPLLQARWTRGFMIAPPGRALALVDYKAEEVYIAAALSGDPQLFKDLETDPYLGLAIRSRHAPPHATPRTHPDIRNRFKPILLGLIYGEGVQKLAAELQTDRATAAAIRAEFRRGYKVLERWLEAVVDTAYATRRLESPLGWPLWVGPSLDRYSLRNHLIQSTGGDILHAACLLAQDAGLMTLATLHDAILLEADIDQIEEQAALLARLMTTASAHVIGTPIPTEIEFTAPRYQLKDADAKFFEDVRRRLDTIPRAG
jgi:hypothetical protein